MAHICVCDYGCTSILGFNEFKSNKDICYHKICVIYTKPKLVLKC